MRYSLLTLIALLTCLAVSLGFALWLIRPGDQRLTRDDNAVLETVLSDLLSQDVATTATGSSELVVHRLTPGVSIDLSPTKILAELETDQHLPTAVAEALERRNARMASLRELTCKNPRIVFADQVDLTGEGVDQSLRRYPEAKCFARVWLPGYADSNQSSVVRFQFGPASHAAVATYFLVKKGGTWEIQWRNFTYFA